MIVLAFSGVGRTGMSQYRCTVLDDAGQVCAIEQFDCDHDADALISATEILGAQTRCSFAEVWCGGRIVARIPDGGRKWRDTAHQNCTVRMMAFDQLTKRWSAHPLSARI